RSVEQEHAWAARLGIIDEFRVREWNLVWYFYHFSISIERRIETTDSIRLNADFKKIDLRLLVEISFRL
ncbi:MAG: hypothetical protein L0220_05780, partial [Acidobacteria bacterium]|nr:hypothetical protein [Acidobacteriota bacterium]